MIIWDSSLSFSIYYTNLKWHNNKKKLHIHTFSIFERIRKVPRQSGGHTPEKQPEWKIGNVYSKIEINLRLIDVLLIFKAIKEKRTKKLSNYTPVTYSSEKNQNLFLAIAALYWLIYSCNSNDHHVQPFIDVLMMSFSCMCTTRYLILKVPDRNIWHSSYCLRFTKDFQLYKECIMVRTSVERFLTKRLLISPQEDVFPA